MDTRERLIELLAEISAAPERTCPHYHDGVACAECTHDRGDTCDMNSRTADYLIANGVTVLPREAVFLTREQAERALRGGERK